MHFECFAQLFTILTFCRCVSYTACTIYLGPIRFKQLKTTSTDSVVSTHSLSATPLWKIVNQLNMRHYCRKWGLWKALQNIWNASVLWSKDFTSIHTFQKDICCKILAISTFQEFDIVLLTVQKDHRWLYDSGAQNNPLL